VEHLHGTVSQLAGKGTPRCPNCRWVKLLPCRLGGHHRFANGSSPFRKRNSHELVSPFQTVCFNPQRWEPHLEVGNMTLHWCLVLKLCLLCLCTSNSVFDTMHFCKCGLTWANAGRRTWDPISDGAPGNAIAGSYNHSHGHGHIHYCTFFRFQVAGFHFGQSYVTSFLWSKLQTVSLRNTLQS
jgi:hypothetical protein